VEGRSSLTAGTSTSAATRIMEAIQNVLVVKFDTNCNVLGAAVYDIDATNPDLPFGLTISPDGSTLYIAGRSTNGAHLLAVRTSDFSVAWAKLFKVTGGGDAANSVTFSGNKLYVTGRTSTLDLFVSRFDAASGNPEGFQGLLDLARRGGARHSRCRRQGLCCGQLRRPCQTAGVPVHDARHQPQPGAREDLRDEPQPMTLHHYRWSAVSLTPSGCRTSSAPRMRRCSPSTRRRVTSHTHSS
jgi:DNA-binding beta-propeller fold protein YncE